MYKKICITNRNLVKGYYMEQIEKVCSMDVDMIILREKDMLPDEYHSLAHAVLQMCERAGKTCILHSFSKVAKRLNHPYIHMPMESLKLMSEKERQWFKVLGASCHSLEDALLAKELGASYITASHIFATQCKEGFEPRGLDFLREICDRMKPLGVDVYALGGIHPDNAASCLQVGAGGVCMMSEYMKA